MPQRLALIGCGAIGRGVLHGLQGDPQVQVTQIIVRASGLQAARTHSASAAPQARVATQLDLSDSACPQLLVECAGHAAIHEHLLPALRQGVPAIVVSVGALHDAQTLAVLGDAAAAGAVRVTLVAGAIGAIDALAAARLGGLDGVEYTGRKPPNSWLGTPAEAQFDLTHISEPVVVFKGSARDAARLYPKNANVAATVSLAGIGLDATRATLIADPGLARNVHRVQAHGAFGRLDITLENEPLAGNPKTSALTVYSVLRAIHNASRSIAI